MIKTSDTETVIESFNRLIKSHEAIGNKIYPEIIRYYLGNRDKLLKEQEGKYVFVCKDKIINTNKEDINLKQDKPDTKEPGMFIKVGHELEIKNSALYGGNITGGLPGLPLTYGNRLDSTFWFTQNDCLVDTGLDTTTFNLPFLTTILSKYPTFPLAAKNLAVIGGNNIIQEGNIDITFCGINIDNKLVQFAQIPHQILIGRDLINLGKLDYDNISGRISFTKH